MAGKGKKGGKFQLLASALFVANLDHGGPDGMVWTILVQLIIEDVVMFLADTV